MERRIQVSESDKTFQQHVRVGDRLATRISGRNARFDLVSELKKTETLGSPTFEVIIVKNKTGSQFLKITPDGVAKHYVFYNGVGWYQSQNNHIASSFPEGEYSFAGKDRDDTTMGEIVVVPNFVFQTPELIRTLPVSTLVQEVDEIEASII